MFSIFIIYSPDRKPQLETTISCLQDMELYDECQKILCVDGETNVNPKDFEIVNVKRPRKLFNWAAAWEAGITTSKFENILYLDSDRILPIDYLTKLKPLIKDNRFVYSKQLIRMLKNYNTEEIKQIRDGGKAEFAIDHRLPHPPNTKIVSLGKNPMSGNTAFTKKTYKTTGGIDPFYEGWGYPDTDYYMRTLQCEFVTIDCTEIHLLHPYAAETKDLKLMNLWNAARFAQKFNMELDQTLKNRMIEYHLTPEMLQKHSTLESFMRKNVKFA